MARRVRIGVQLHPQHTTMAHLRAAWTDAEALGADSIWTWDHFYPLYGDDEGAHFEGMTTLAAMAATTTRARIGLLVTCNSYRNPDLLADMIRTVDHLAGGRATLGLGAGWFERDYTEYGYEFGTARDRLARLEEDLPRIRARLDRLTPAPLGPLPILIGGSGEKVTLRLVAEHADAWNSFGPPETFAAKNAVLDQWCERIGRDPRTIERTVAIDGKDLDRLDDYVDAGAEHIIYMRGARRESPFDLSGLERMVAWADG